MGNHNEMNVVIHQAVGKEAHTVILGVISKNAKQKGSVFWPEEHTLPVVASLDNMMCQIRYNDSRSSAHTIR